MDHGLLLVPLGLLIAWRWRSRPTRVAAATVAFTLTMLPYLWWNVSQFGALQPVSGVAKQSLELPWPTAWQNLGFVHRRVYHVVGWPRWMTFSMLAASLLVVSAVVRRATTRFSHPAGRAVFSAFAVGTAVQVGYWLFLMVEVLVPWLLVGVAALLSATAAVQIPKRLHLVALLLVAVSTLGWVAAKRVPQPERRLAQVALAWLAELPPKTRYAVYDGWLVRLQAPTTTYVCEMSGLVGDLVDARAGKRRGSRWMADRHRIDVVFRRRSQGKGWPGWREVRRSAPGELPFTMVMLRRSDPGGGDG